ncbi:D-arabinono-1,4-lactone oxidase [Amphritea pacifica]|uniref:FAD-binding protein n=1 Tax=Amphritea pacifica TaxID=2811233 RepID=A0ABS2W8C2_9GAMM|nr:D-arabinono-1,4-lactone oxidase [Amphritea pacifica]MBN0987637.1 FAD-binding protein [Amphritea pacifica]MBN1009051.1 FAD-binding protein [Amphritea pacifica]
MKNSRRRFLQGTAAAATAAAATLLPGCATQRTQPSHAVAYAPDKPLPWMNWAGNLHCYPAHREAPETEAALVDSLQRARGTVRAVGASHSFTPQVPTDETLIATDLLSGLIDYDKQSLQAELWAGTRLHNLGPLLADIGQALPNMPDVDRFALGGAIANSAHATGAGFGSMSTRICGLTLATPNAELIRCSATENSELFQAARTSLGTLGIITRVRLQNVESFNLTETNRVEYTEDVLDDLEQRVKSHRHFEFLPLPNSDLAATVSTDLAKPGDTTQGEDDPESLNKLRSVFENISWMPGSGLIYDWLLKNSLADDATTTRTGPSYRIFGHPRLVRFREMEYIVPAQAGPACIREILQTIRERKIPVCFPLEYRTVAADDIWLSMFEGRQSVAIAVHQFHNLDHKTYFEQIEPIFWKYEGRPHWGKLHTLDTQRLASLYPHHWKDFLSVRESIDPQGRMLNPYLKQLFGVA